MSDFLRFSTFNQSKIAAPTPCGLCGSDPAAFEYALTSDRNNVIELQGRSCLRCATRLLRIAEHLQVVEWAELTLGRSQR